MDKQTLEHQALFRRKLHRVTLQMAELQEKAEQKQGVIFRRHNYGRDELLNSKQHKKIRAITEKVGNDVMHWHLNGNFPVEGVKVFLKQRRMIYAKLSQLERQIDAREETWWERNQPSLQKALNQLIGTIPEPLRNRLPKQQWPSLLNKRGEVQLAQEER